jgi:hypothetical protein
MTWVAVAVGGGAIVGGMLSADASRSAANKQSDAANNASQMQWNEFQQNQQNLKPYMDIGTNAINPMYRAMGYNLVGGNLARDMANPLNQQFSFNPGDLTKTPGYQFALQQGMQGINNSSAAKGLGMSSANMRDAARFATGLADQTYGDQFNRALNTYQTNYNSAANNAARMAGLVQMGQNSAAGVGNMGMQTAMNSGNLLTSGAAAQAAGQIGQANAINGGLSSVGNYMMMNNMMNRMYPAGATGGMYGSTGGFEGGN